MALSTILREVYTSAPTTEIIVPTIEIQVPGLTPLRFLHGYQDMSFNVSNDPVNPVYATFEATAISIALPEAGVGSGAQSLKFGFACVTAQAQQYVEQALQSTVPSNLIYREYLVSNPAAPARTLYTMPVVGGVFDGISVAFEASYMDMLNLAWPRERYTIKNAPGTAYL